MVVVVDEKKATEVATLEEAREVIGELLPLVKENHLLRLQLDALKHRLFGKKSEKGVPAEQGHFPFVGEPAAGEVSPGASDEEVQESQPPTRRHKGRRPLPKEFPRVREEVPARPEDLHCSGCNAEKVKIREEISEAVDYQPASIFIRERVRGVYACPDCETEISCPPLPPRPIEKGRAEPGLLAYVVTSKYADHLPLYRLEQILERHALTVSRRTLSEWNGAVADLLTPIVTAMKKEILSSAWIQCDDTTLTVTEDGSRTGHMWAYRSMEDDVVYDFTWARNREGPMRMLEGYRGYLQADAAPGYDELFRTRPEIVEVACWAHARRYFKEAADSSLLFCRQILVLIGRLYDVEREAKGTSAEERRQARQKHALPLLAEIKTALETAQDQVLPKSPTAKAIAYTLSNWQALTRYIDDGRLHIDNNGAERAIKPVVIGRKNWLFCGSESAAHRAAILLSLVQSSKHHGVDPFTYLRDVIDRVSVHPMSRVGELTPREWKRLRQLAAGSDRAAA